MDTLCVSFPPVPDDLADWDCGDALADLGNLDSFDLSPEDFADPNSNCPPTPSAEPARPGSPIIQFSEQPQHSSKQTPSGVSGLPSASPHQPSYGDLGSPTIPAVSGPSPPASPFAPYAQRPPSPPPQRAPAAVQALPSNHNRIQSSRSSPQQLPPAPRQDEAWQRFMNKLEDIKAKLDDFNDMAPEASSSAPRPVQLGDHSRGHSGTGTSTETIYRSQLQPQQYAPSGPANQFQPGLQGSHEYSADISSHAHLQAPAAAQRLPPQPIGLNSQAPWSTGGAPLSSQPAGLASQAGWPHGMAPHAQTPLTDAACLGVPGLLGSGLAQHGHSLSGALSIQPQALHSNPGVAGGLAAPASHAAPSWHGGGHPAGVHTVSQGHLDCLGVVVPAGRAASAPQGLDAYPGRLLTSAATGLASVGYADPISGVPAAGQHGFHQGGLPATTSYGMPVLINEAAAVHPGSVPGHKDVTCISARTGSGGSKGSGSLCTDHTTQAASGLAAATANRSGSGGSDGSEHVSGMGTQPAAHGRQPGRVQQRRELAVLKAQQKPFPAGHSTGLQQPSQPGVIRSLGLGGNDSASARFSHIQGMVLHPSWQKVHPLPISAMYAALLSRRMETPLPLLTYQRSASLQTLVSPATPVPDIMNLLAGPMAILHKSAARCLDPTSNMSRHFSEIAAEACLICVVLAAKSPQGFLEQVNRHLTQPVTCETETNWRSLKDRVNFSRRQWKQIEWLWNIYSSKMSELRPTRHQLLSKLAASDLEQPVPTLRPGHHFLPALLEPAEALVDNIKLMQETHLHALRLFAFGICTPWQWGHILVSNYPYNCDGVGFVRYLATRCSHPGATPP